MTDQHEPHCPACGRPLGPGDDADPYPMRALREMGVTDKVCRPCHEVMEYLYKSNILGFARRYVEAARALDSRATRH